MESETKSLALTASSRQDKGPPPPDDTPQPPVGGAGAIRPAAYLQTDVRAANDNTPRSANDNKLRTNPPSQRRKRLMLGVALTGAKYTPHNHTETGDRIFDAINSGDTIRCSSAGIAEELTGLYDLGARYLHWHARSEKTREQVCSLDSYRAFGITCRRLCPDAIISFGASRNGPEIAKAIAARGEWSRIEHATLSATDGGANFVTAQAAIELQIVTDMESQGFVEINEAKRHFRILKNLKEYSPSKQVTIADLATHSTSRGGIYGASSAEVQYATLQRTVLERNRLGVPFEVEWVQSARSSFLTWYLATFMEPAIRRLNITVLFGFSPKLPFPACYSEFRAVINKARAIASSRPRSSPLRVSVTCGAAVLPQHAKQHVKPIDVGLLTGLPANALERLVAYACQPDSGVDILRVGMEDTPYSVDPAGIVLPVTNLMLLKETVRQVEQNEATIIVDRKSIQNFVDIDLPPKSLVFDNKIIRSAG